MSFAQNECKGGDIQNTLTVLIHFSWYDEQERGPLPRAIHIKDSDKMNTRQKRYSFTSLEQSLPLFIESIGTNQAEYYLSRPNGYPYFHWLHTIEGEGRFCFSNQDYVLRPGQGILLLPHIPHEYEAVSAEWSTGYVTFGGAAVESILTSLGIHFSALFTETARLSFQKGLLEMIRSIEKDSEFSRLESSRDLFHFLILLRKYGQMNNQPSLSQSFDKIRPVVEWLEEKYGEDVGLPEMAAYAKTSPQYLNTLFRDAFGISPYAFLIQLRIREAKKASCRATQMSLTEISERVGFQASAISLPLFGKGKVLLRKSIEISIIFACKSDAERYRRIVNFQPGGRRLPPD